MESTTVMGEAQYYQYMVHLVKESLYIKLKHRTHAHNAGSQFET